MRESKFMFPISVFPLVGVWVGLGGGASPEFAKNRKLLVAPFLVAGAAF